MTTQQSSRPDGVLYFIGGQLLFEHHNAQGAVVRKCLAPKAARQAFTLEQTDSGWLSPRTIRIGENERGSWVIQRYDPARYRITLEEALPIPGQTFPRRTLHVWLPGMIFLGSHKDYYIWAYKAWKESATTLYRTPVPNIQTNGKICFGDNHPSRAATDTIDTTWSLFWRSPFNHDLVAGKSQRYPDSILTLLARLHRNKHNSLNTFPQDDLTRSEMTMSKILTQLNPQHREDASR
jgi:PRTRC genetic system protein B